MKALMYYGIQDMRIVDIDTPMPQGNEVRVRVCAASICGSDLLGYKGLSVYRKPMLVMGHEFSGIVDQVGPDVKNAKIGDRVAVVPNLYCGHCGECRRQAYNICSGEERRIIGTSKNGNTQGAFAEYVCVRESNLLPIVDTLSYEEAALIEPLAVSYHGVKKLGDVNGQTVIVFGAGAIGLFAIQSLKYRGAKNIVCSDPVAERLTAASQMGATHVCADASNLDDLVSELTGGNGADGCVDCAGVADTVNCGIRLTKNGGTLIEIAGAKPVIDAFALVAMISKELRIVGSYTYTTEMEEVTELLNEGKMVIAPAVGKPWPLEEGPVVFQKIIRGEMKEAKVILRP